MSGSKRHRERPNAPSVKLPAAMTVEERREYEERRLQAQVDAALPGRKARIELTDLESLGGTLTARISGEVTLSNEEGERLLAKLLAPKILDSESRENDFKVSVVESSPAKVWTSAERKRRSKPKSGKPDLPG